MWKPFSIKLKLIKESLKNNNIKSFIKIVLKNILLKKIIKVEEKINNIVIEKINNNINNLVEEESKVINKDFEKIQTKYKNNRSKYISQNLYL